jgi:hypothetical protein
MDFLKFVFGPMPVWKHFRYRPDGSHWCPRRLEWTLNLAPPEIERYPEIWIRRARRWFQGKRDHQTP